MTEPISSHCKCKFNSRTCNSNQKWNNKTWQFECKNYRNCKKYYSWNPSTFICENSKYLKSIADTPVIECDEIIIVMDIVSTKKTNTIAIKKTNIVVTNITITASINCHSKNIRACYILHSVFLLVLLLVIIIIVCYHYAKQKDIIQNGE